MKDVVAAYGLADLELEKGEEMHRSFVDCGSAAGKVHADGAAGFAFGSDRETFGGWENFAAAAVAVDVAAVECKLVAAAADERSVVAVEVLIVVVGHQLDVAVLLGFD